jgi:Ca2+-binding RTX toxin-like protein
VIPRLTRLASFALGLCMVVPGTAAAVTTVQLDPQLVPQHIAVDGDASSDRVEVAYDAGSSRILISEPGITSVGSACTDNGDTVACTPPAPGPSAVAFAGGVVLALGGGDNTAHVSPVFPSKYPVSFFGGSGSDVFTGGPETDTLDPGPGPDRLSGGGGEDSVNYGQRVTPVFATLNGSPNSGNELDGPPGARDTLGTDIEDIFGGNGPDKLVGNASPNKLIGFKSRDVLIGLGGADRLAGEYGNELAVGTASANRLYGGRGRDLLLGEVGGDELFGGPGIDRIDAKDKQREKTIDCGSGNDRRERATRDGGDPHPISC